jgi:serine phosphatase RsbU (regulator of sigma subunit)
MPELQAAQWAAAYYGQRLGGDFYDVIHPTPTRLLFALMDVAGRVHENRSILAGLQRVFRSRGAELFALGGCEESDERNMSELCLAINHKILESGVRACPTFAACYDRTSGAVCYLNAGHIPALLRSGTDVSELASTGVPLGLFPHPVGAARSLSLEAGASLVLASRGVIEAKRQGEEWGTLRLREALENTTAEEPKELCLALLDRVRQFTRTPPTHDDVTFLALRHSPLASSAPGA